MTQRSRIFLGTTEIVRQLYELADAFRSLGYEAHTGLSELHPFYADLPYNYLLYPELPFPKPVQQARHPLVSYPRRLLNRTYRTIRSFGHPDFLTQYDVYIFQFGESLLPDNRDFPLLKARGKKIVSIFQGSDIRHWSATEPVRELFDLKAYEFYREASTLNQSLAKLRMAERYADVIFFQPSYGELAIRPYMHLYLAMNLDLYPHQVPGREVPVVVHAPSKRQVKGTTEILATLKKLEAEGVRFTFKLLEGLPNTEVIRQLVDADVVVDELNEAHYGMLGLEAMATGCAVAGGNLPDLVPLPPAPPIVHLNPANLYAQLGRLLTDKSLRLQLAAAGRPFVEKYHDRSKVAQHILDCLNSPENRKCDYYPGFFARHYSLPDGEIIGADLKRLTAQIVRQYGLPEDVAPQDMIERDLMSDEAFNDSVVIPRWKPNTDAQLTCRILEESLS
jgi:glycosyltransferase involved in cell wall biosynthesis